MAGGKGDEADNDGAEGAEEERDKDPDEPAEAADGVDDNEARGAGNCDARKGRYYIDPGSAVTSVAAEDAFFDIHKEFIESVTDNITNINGKHTDYITEVNEDDGDNEAREDTFDAIIINTDASEL